MDKEKIIQRITAWSNKVKAYYENIVMTESDWDSLIRSIENNRPFYVSAGFNDLYTYYMEILIDEINQNQKGKTSARKEQCA